MSVSSLSTASRVITISYCSFAGSFLLIKILLLMLLLDCDAYDGSSDTLALTPVLRFLFLIISLKEKYVK